MDQDRRTSRRQPATDPDGRPRWSIDLADWEAFERRREAQPETPRVRRKRKQSGAKDYFAD